MNESHPVALDDAIHKHSLTYRLPPPTYTVFVILFSHIPFSQKKKSYLGETTAGFSLLFLLKSDDIQDGEIIEFIAQTEYFRSKIILLVDTCRPMLIKSPYPGKCVK